MGGETPVSLCTPGLLVPGTGRGYPRTPEGGSGCQKRTGFGDKKPRSQSQLHPLPAGGLWQITEVSKPPLVNGVTTRDPRRVVLMVNGAHICGSTLQLGIAGHETNICKH